jgi:ubiquinone/menaquinone biosynthesis C-methylase UbiE
MPQVPDWPVAFFDEDYLAIYRPMITEERTRQEADFIVRALEPAPGAKLLDLACGLGRHALLLARGGYQVTGLDFNQRYLDLAGAEAERAGIAGARWMQGDMRALPFRGEFDAAYSYFTSFGYFDDAENFAVLQGVARALEPGGRFLIDLANRDWLLTHPQQRTWNQREDGSLLMEETSLELKTSVITSRQVLIRTEGAQVHKEYHLRAYTCAEMTWLLSRVGLRVSQVWGGPDGTEFSTESRRLILRAELAAGAAGT